MGMVGEGPMAQGRKRIEGQGVELWQEGRKIATFDPEQGLMRSLRRTMDLDR